jgi:beta-lactamase class A
MKRGRIFLRFLRMLCVVISLYAAGCSTIAPQMNNRLRNFTLDYGTPVDAELQRKIESIDGQLRARYGMTTAQSAVGVLDLNRLRLAMIHSDRIEYAASVAKIGILLAWFHRHPEVGDDVEANTRHELGLMIKASSNEMATKFSREMGLAAIQEAINSYGLYDQGHGGGIWMGKHYGKSDERIGDPVGGHSHAATVRQLLHFYLLLEQGKLVSPAASKAMRDIFVSPEIPHDQIKFVKALGGRNVEILRKWGSWQNWLHDTAIVTGPGRHYILVALTNHPKGDEYLVDFARAIDALMMHQR